MHDSDRIGPYGRWQGNLDAEVLVVGQDFADVESFERLGGWPGEDVGTNETLVELLAEAGIRISPPQRGVPDDQLYFTNAVLCLKKGGMGAAVPRSCAQECAIRLRDPTVESHDLELWSRSVGWRSRMSCTPLPGCRGARRPVEPYSLRRPATGNLLLYVYELDRGGRVTHTVKAFKVPEIQAAEITDRPFSPQFRVEL